MLFPMMALLIVSGAEPNQAEKLFRDMEDKVTKAKNIECAYEVKVEFGKEMGSVKGTLFIGEGNKVREQTLAEFAGMKEEKQTNVANGENGVLGVEKNNPVLFVPKWLQQRARAAISRTGTHDSGFVVQAPGLTGKPDKQDDSKYGIDERFPVTEFKLDKKEMVGDIEALVIEYKLTRNSLPRETMAMRVWLDSKTHLPLKRVLRGTQGEQKITITETITKLDLDAKINPKLFELPKK